ncbi:efflux transporter outer membrane subunit [Desulforhabdus sp. TSK]|uniref:efflux transporter outer membrane subunit n=1 Tax=Desulforhabdus sp. TSK TaxID=2925014 RepID=UPI001FC8E4F3|nr:efflux transporter outer membrane subunit [Desulforhabdus sp. TSK]GKT10441.1 adeC/adeK/oprM family multidrug efflux complex outer membrane factor [Desulforhabdus sp. TSK]
MTKKTLMIVSVLVCLNGCTMIPKYERPEAPVPAAWPSGVAYKEAQAGGSEPLASDLQWREFFTDERLEEVIATALENNRDLRVAALNVERARALYRVQRAELLPTVDASAMHIRERVPGDISGGSGSASGAVILKQYSADVGISSWEIDFFGRIRSLSKRALEEFFSTEQARRSAQILLISEVANAYLTLAADRENLQLSKYTLETQQAAYNLIKRRFEVGLAPELDLRQVQTRVDTARVDVARFTELAAQDENALNLLVGSPVPADLLPEALSTVSPLPDVSPGISSEVLLSRPDIVQAEHTLKAANANIGAARAAFFPRISLTTAIGSASGDLSGLFKSGSLAWNYAPQIVLPIFDARTWSGLKVSKVDKEIAITQYESVIQSAFRDVADALATKGTVGNQLEAQLSLLDATERTYKLSNARYEKGTDIYLNVLDAQRSLYAAQQQLISIQLSKLTNQVRLYAVLGGGGDEEY